MNVYEIFLLVGGFGFLAVAVTGMSHGGLGHHGHGGGLGHGGTGHGHWGHGFHFGKGSHIPKGVKAAKDQGSSWLMLLSPIDLFSMSLGAGAAGLLLQKVLSPSLLVWAALLGALFFNFIVIKPLFGIAMQFVSKPSEGLEGTVMVTGEAISKFDSEGRGLVRLTLDGQIIQLLADLDGPELELGETVVKGDTVTVLKVDAKRNRCTVSKLHQGRNP